MAHASTTTAAQPHSAMPRQTISSHAFTDSRLMRHILPRTEYAVFGF
jgi:hypothetical protein